MKREIKFNQSRIAELEAPEKGRVLYWDTKVTNLAVRVTPTGHKSFVVIMWKDGGNKFVTIGRFPSMTVKQAQEEAQKVTADLHKGIDPNKKEEIAEVKKTTLEQCLNAYIDSRDNQRFSENTRKSYRAILENWLSDWKAKPLGDITTNMVNKRFNEISKKYPVAGNNTFRLVRALFNFARDEWEDKDGNPVFPFNPTRKLSHAKKWHKEQRRQGVLKNYELKPWFNALELFEQTRTTQGGVQPTTIADYLRFVLMTGLRRREASNLEWSNVDFKGRTITIEQTKNRQTHILPITDYVYQLLEKRYQNRSNDFVFEGRGGVSLQEPKKAVERIRALSDLYFTIHDLRRTFISVAESLELSPYAIKRMVNHKIPEQDVTGGYIIWEVERLREPLQRVNDKILKLAEIKETAQVVSLETARKVK
ncbi:tyrosine-type recombinase/integrase [Kangiella japonica]|uniref:Tyrosine-type recombinase/integrase n=1 Tax=Kangiella japonica TaxID=647384 RepID=A0ABN0SUL3_9GAMM